VPDRAILVCVCGHGSPLYGTVGAVTQTSAPYSSLSLWTKTDMCNVPKNPSRHPCPRAADDSRCTVTVSGPQKLKVRLNAEVDETGFDLTASVVQCQLYITRSASQYHPNASRGYPDWPHPPDRFLQLLKIRRVQRKHSSEHHRL
jgi:hypothetical protein